MNRKEELMRNIRNLVFIKHERSNRQYLFEVPLDVRLFKGDKVFCDTIRGRSVGICETESFLVDDRVASYIIGAVGAYEPLKPVVGYATEIKNYKLKPFDSPDLPF